MTILTLSVRARRLESTSLLEERQVGLAAEAAIDRPLGAAGEDPTELGFDVNVAGHGAGGPGSYYGEQGMVYLAGERSVVRWSRVALTSSTSSRWSIFSIRC
mgnify:CR=1 FL=1